MTEQNGMKKKMNEKQHKDDRCFLGWGGWGVPV